MEAGKQGPAMSGGGGKGFWESRLVICCPGRLFSVCSTNTVLRNMDSDVRQMQTESLLGNLLMCEFEQIFYSL